MKNKSFLSKLAVWTLLAAYLFSIAAFVSADGPTRRKLLVTAYYSPLPDQRVYIRGTYEGDIRLNGRGTNGADGTQVYVGMLAAPKTYPFGTRVSIPGLGTGVVHDRGGAILAHGEFDRIDVWMGRGEEGLARALNWGARWVEGEVIYGPSDFESDLDFSWLPTNLPKGLKAVKLQDPSQFNKVISKASSSDDIKELQEALTSLGFYAGPISGSYDSDTTQAVLAFQLSEGIVPSKQVSGAGRFGPTTQKTLRERLESFNAKVVQETRRLEDNRLLLISGLGKNATGDDVMHLQQMLWELGYFHGELNGKYDKATMDAVFEFQKSFGVLDSERDQGAGYFGKKTHEALVSAIGKKIDRIAEYPKEMQSWVPAKLDLPLMTSFNSESLVIDTTKIVFDSEIMNTKIVQEKHGFDFDLSLNDQGEHVKKLQQFLISKGYLAKGLDTGSFGAKTKQAVIKFQLEQGILKSEKDTVAGRVGPATRAALNKLI